MLQYHNDLKIFSLCGVLISFGCVCRFYFSHFGAAQQQRIHHEVVLALSAWFSLWAEFALGFQPLSDRARNGTFS
jgi:hypothetical protein